MISWLASLQPLFLGGVLLWSGGVKALSRSAARTARRTALASLIGEARAPGAYRMAGALELALAASLLFPPVHAAEIAAAVLLTLVFAGYLGYSRRVAPDAPCNCMSARRTPVTWRSFARAGFLASAALLATVAGGAWPGALGDHAAGGAVFLTLAVLVVVTLSAEADHLWLLPLRRLRIRWRHPLAGLSYDMPLESTLQQLRASPAYQRVGALIRSDLRESWDDGDTRFLCYTAEYQGQQATAIFAAPRDRYAPEEVRVAIVDEPTQTTLLAATTPVPASS